MRKSFCSLSFRPSSSVVVQCDQFPLQPQNINPRTGWPRSDVSLFELAQRGLVSFDGNRLTPLPDIGERTTLDNPSRRYVDTLSEKQEEFVAEQLRKIRKKKDEQSPNKVDVIIEPVPAPAPAPAE